MTAERWRQVLVEHIHLHCSQMMREPAGVLTHPYVVPSGPDSPLYSTALWDWDSWLTSVVLGQLEIDSDSKDRFLTYERGSILNFLEHTDSDGVMPVQLTSEGALLHGEASGAGGFRENMHKPVIAQHAALLTRRHGSAEWVRPHLATLERFLRRYLESHVDGETGLAYWQTDFAIGVDNDPSVFYRPPGSTASVYLNSLLFRELLAYGSLLEDLGDVQGSLLWRGRAQDLSDAMNTHLWDERDGTYYSADIGLRSIDPGDWLHRGAPRHWASLLLRIDSWSSFMPMWAGIADSEQASRMVSRVRDSRTFSAEFGIRTLSKVEKMFELRATHNPSNWLGPVWGVSNYLVFRGLQRYGYLDYATELAEKTVRLFGRDLEATGSLHEYYNPDNGDPIVTRDFENWNFLVLNMIAFLENRPVIAEY